MYSVGRRTKRWPLCLFFNFLDVVAINSAVIYKAVKQDGGMARKDFIKQLALQLMRDALNMRNQAKILSRDLQVLIQKHAGTSSLEEEVDEEKEFEGYETIQDKMEKLELKLRRALEGIQSTADTKQAKGLETVILPKFELPHFYGDANSWFKFKDVFGMVIDQNPGLNDLQKLQYLGSAVKGEAARLIRGFPVLSESYKQAWDTLVSRYDNQRELAYAQLNKIFKIKQMKNPSAKALRELLDTCNESVRNLGSLGLQKK
ncbi:hypothetical protein LAZ67_1000761 [Cordylochernes scorpioides]|uniref:Uncharacterized protein n=1 Tax=Cordylochernes scorpioides TaxID=51811 RepID=A0ABY6JWD2_9ARAC|nr:hypothetical protein LAZ67_1000761 [Cordylochernes scorpioides]